MAKTIFLVLLALGYVLGLKALNERAQVEMASIQKMYTQANSLTDTALSQGQQIQTSYQRP